MKPISLLLLLPMLVYISVVMVWHSQGINPITGDEPHYLLMAESLLRDGDLAVLNNYHSDTPVARELPGNVAPTDTHSQGEHSIHGVGLPLLLLPAYALGGVLGAKLWLALLVGLTPLAVYRVAQVFLPDTGWSITIALLIGLGQPFVTASGQIYPDLIAGLIMFWLLGQEAGGRRQEAGGGGQEAGGRRAWVGGLLLGYLPWLHIKFLLPAMIICLTCGQEAGGGGQEAGGGGQEAGGRRQGARFLGFLPLGISLLGLGCYNQWAFGAILGPYQPGDATTSLTQIAMIFLGLHIDRMQGLFIHVPLLLLGVFGLAFFIAEKRRQALSVGLVYLTVMLPHAAHTNWYGGTSFAGRFFWSTALLWCFPLLSAVRYLTARRRFWPAICLLIAASLTQGVFLAKVLIPNNYTYNSTLDGAANWLASNPYSDFFDLPAYQRAQFLPSFRDVDTYLRSPTNWGFIGLLVGLAVAGYCARRRRMAHDGA